MSTEVKFRRGSTTQHASFTGAQGEVTVDTDLNTLRIHDGATVGGHRALLHSEFVGTGTGTLTQIDTGVGLSGGPITASGTLTLDTATQTTLTNSQTAYSWGDHATFSYLTNIIGQNLGNLLNVNDSAVTDGQILQFQSNTSQYLPVDMPSGGSGGGGSSAFTGLTDTPSNFTGEAFKILRVNTAGTALEFIENTGEANLASNRGAGEGLVFFAKDNSTGDLQFRSIRAGQGMTVTQTPNEITIDAPNLTYTAGTGLDLNNNIFSIEGGYVKNTGNFNLAGDITFSGNAIFQQQLTYGSQIVIDHPASVNKEIFFRGKVADALNDFVEMSNAAPTTAQLSPCVRGGVESSTAIASMSVIGEVPTAKDTGTYPMMDFIVKKGGNVIDYAYGQEAAVTVRPLFDFKNYNTSVLIIKPSGTEIATGLTVNGDTLIPHNLKFKNSFSLKSGLESAISAATYPGCVGVASNELYFSATSNSGEWLRVAKSTEVPAGVWYKFSADSGTSAEATSVSDELTIAGGTGIDTAIAGNTITITNTGGSGGGGGTTQDLWATLTADTGTTTANSSTDALTITGGNNVTTTITGDEITIDSSISADVFKSIAVANNDTVIASGLEDTITLVAGPNIDIDTDAGAQSITITSTASGSGGGGTTTAFGTISVQGQVDVVADNAASAGDTLTLIAGTGIALSTDNSADSITVTNSAQATTAFSTIAVTGTNAIAADSATDTLTFNAGPNIQLASDVANDTITISASAVTQETYKSIAVSGQNTLTADQSDDTVTFVEGSGITITTSSTNDTITFAAGAATFDPRSASARTFWVQTPVYDYVISNTYHAVDTIAVTGNNLGGGTAVSPTIYLIGGHTYGFALDCSSHGFVIKTSSGEGVTGNTSNAYDTGLRHIDTLGTWSYGSNAQGKTSGTLFWTVPQVISGNYIYQCTAHANMHGIMKVVDITTLFPMGAATSSVAGTAGIAPAPSAGDESKVLAGDASWIAN